MKQVPATVFFLVFSIGLAPWVQGALAETVSFEGVVVDEYENPLNGEHRVELRYFAPAGTDQLHGEAFVKVRVSNGRLRVDLGCGSTDGFNNTAGLDAVFAANPELEIEFTISSIRQHPRMKILPAGHSRETRAILAGADVDDDRGHPKGYWAKNARTAVQTGVLQPSSGTALADPYYSTHQTNPFLLDMEFLGVSEPLRDMVVIPQIRPKHGEPGGSDINPIRHGDMFDEDGHRFGTQTVKIDDPLASASQRDSGRATPGLIVDFEGISATGWVPPDTEGAVGPNHYVQVVNTSFRIFDKTGTPVTDAMPTNTLWTGASGACGMRNDGDAVFLYDELADRWVFTQFINGFDWMCFAVSTTGDPTGSYYHYQADTARFPDYPKLGVWPDPDNNAYFMGTNSGFAGEYDVYAFDRANLLAGTTPRPAQYFQNHPSLLLPADLDGDNLPPSGTPGLFYTFRDGGESYFIPPSPVDTLDLWEFDVDWTTPSSSTFTLVQSFVPPALAEFNWTVCGFFSGYCLEQPGTTSRLDALSQWPMQRLQYRNFESSESLVGSWTVDVLASGDHAAPRWFALRRSIGGSWLIDQQGTFAPDSKHRWVPSVALDGSGNMAMGYSVMEASSNTYPSLRYATRSRESSEFDAEANLAVGNGFVTGSNRWGDYASMEVDPSDDCTFWFTSEYIAATGDRVWNTRVGSFRHPECTGTLALYVHPPVSEVCADSGSASFHVALSAPFSGTTNLSVSDCPTGATCSFDPNPIVHPATTSTLSVSGLPGVAPGSHTISATATDSVAPSTTETVDLEFSLFGGNPPAPVLASPSDGAMGLLPEPTITDFSWSVTAASTSTDFQLATDADFSNIVASGTTLLTNGASFALPTGSTLFWRAKANNVCGPSGWSATNILTTKPSICFSPEATIPDYDFNGVDDTATVDMLGTISDLDFATAISHWSVGDLVVTLTHDGTGTSAVVIDRPGVPGTPFGCDEKHIDVILDDEATDPVEDACLQSGVAINGILRPENPLDAFDGLELSGSWTLNVADQSSYHHYDGTLHSWCLYPFDQRWAEQPFFADGFESGSTSAWSNVAP